MHAVFPVMIAAGSLLLLWRSYTITRHYNKSDRIGASVRQMTYPELEQKWLSINQRFPEKKFPRLTEKLVRDLLRLDDSAVIEHRYQDYNIESWLALYEEYPFPPRTKKEQMSREAQLWLKWLDIHTFEDDERTIQLNSKDKITAYFCHNERLIFREYYAATGIVIESIINQELLWSVKNRRGSRHFDDLIDEEVAQQPPEKRSELARKFIEDPEYSRVFLDWRDQAAQAALARWDAAFEPHMEKWGEWYYANIVQAFQSVRRSEIAADAGAARMIAGPS